MPTTKHNKVLYASVLLLDDDRSHALLIQKTHPEWQAGNLNFIGGKVEKGEAPIKGAIREVYEEAGIKLKEQDLCLFRHLHVPNSPIEVFFYWATCSLDQAIQRTEEPLVLVKLDKLPKNMVPYVPWMIELACAYSDK